MKYRCRYCENPIVWDTYYDCWVEDWRYEPSCLSSYTGNHEPED